jgi:hypothetical protein
MSENSSFRRLGLVRMDGPHDAVRRYKLARLEEVALAWPAPDQDGQKRPPKPHRNGGPPEAGAEAPETQP